MDYFSLLKPFIYLLEPELAHNLAIWSLKHKLLPSAAKLTLPNLATRLWGIDFEHPLGLAAGFDKNGVCIPAILSQGFAFTEIGTVTVKAQTGNPKPRLFRLNEDSAIINRMGFNNLGADFMLKQLQDNHTGIIGINIGKNKDTQDAVADYLQLMTKFYHLSSYIVVNISSPNTPGLRDLQQGDNFHNLIQEVTLLRNRLAETRAKFVPLIVKIAPDLSFEQLEEIVTVVLKFQLDGLTISNTTIARNNLISKFSSETGGLSGKPLFNSSNQILEHCYRLTKGKIPLIGVGGISDGDDAYHKITLGASLLQIYSALIYQGFGLLPKILKRVSYLLERDGFNNINEAVGSRVKF